MIRLAKAEELERLQQIYAVGREYMKNNGNPTQWAPTYPTNEALLEDIAADELYVCHDGDDIYGVFKLMFGLEPAYAAPIEGKWLNEEPYGTVHRIASAGTRKGVFDEALNYCKSRIDNVRIDTHPNNKTMQHLCERSGFQKCGMIIIADGSPRIIYHWIKGVTE